MFCRLMRVDFSSARATTTVRGEANVANYTPGWASFMALFGLALVVADRCLLRFSALVSTRDDFFACDFPELDDLSLRTLKPVRVRVRCGLPEASMVYDDYGRLREPNCACQGAAESREGRLERTILQISFETSCCR
jgi:hypothetical protein